MKQKQIQKKGIAWLLCFMLAVVLSTGIVVEAVSVRAVTTEEETLSEDTSLAGVKVSTAADKRSYKIGAMAKVTVSVTNTNSYDLNNVTVEYKLPAGFKAANGQTKQTVDSLKAGETKEFTVDTQVAKYETGDVDMASYFTPLTITLIVIAALVVLALVFFIIKKFNKKMAKKSMALFLVCALAGAGVYQNPIDVKAVADDGMAVSDDYYHTSVHDPSVVKDPETGTYYIFGSHLAFAKSKDLYSWEKFTNNINSDYRTLFAEPWKWASAGGSGDLSGRMWAPDVIYNKTMKKWCMYMSIDGDNWCSAICLLTADNIEGPYDYQGIVVYSGVNNAKTKAPIEETDMEKVLGKDADLSAYESTARSCINAIDPNVRYDDDGNLYMAYGSWSAGIYMLKLDPATGMRDYNTKYVTEDNVSDAYYGTKLAGGHYNSGEGPYILKAGKYYYLFISYAGLEATGGYQMRVYRSEKIDGPYVDQNGESAICKRSQDMKKTNYGVKLFGSYDMAGLGQVQVAQGHNSAFVDDDGKIFLVYHTRFQSTNGKNETHSVRVHQMFVNEDGWLVAAPYEYCGETLPEEPYSADEVAGEYDFIYHEPTKSYNVVNNKQYGVVGQEEETTQSVQVAKEITVDHKKAPIKCTVSFSHEGSAKVMINKDGTVTGDYAGTWKYTSGANVEMTLNGVVYKGVFIKQHDETMFSNTRMTFTLLGNNVTVWGVDDKEADANENSED